MKNMPSDQFFMPHNVLEEAKFINLSTSAKVLYMYLCKLKNRLQTKKSDKFYRHISTLSRDVGLCSRTIMKAKQELIKAQYIEVERDYYTTSGNRSADVYHLNGYKYKINTNLNRNS